MNMQECSVVFSDTHSFTYACQVMIKLQQEMLHDDVMAIDIYIILYSSTCMQPLCESIFSHTAVPYIEDPCTRS